jgi:hypothetical protein
MGDHLMGGRTALSARTGAVPWRLAAYAATMSLALGALLAYALAGPRASSLPAGAHAASVRTLLSGLPLTALDPVSATLGAADRSYRVVPSGAGGLSAHNPAQRLGVSFQAGRVLLSSGATRVALGLRGVGLGRSLGATGRAQMSSQANRVLFARPGLSEWYANGPLGLEQGFTVSRAPAGDASAPLALSLAVSGDARATLGADRRSIVFTGHVGPSLRYGDLIASDARGRALHSWLELQGQRILLRVDARGAHYPLRIDPLVQQQKLVGSGGAGEGLFGYSVALSGDGSSAIIGAPRSSGGVWAFVREGAKWSSQQLAGGEAPSGGETCPTEEAGEISGCGIGRSVALSGDGDTALVGAPRANEGAGEARVYIREGAKWTAGTALVPASIAPSSHFGKSVALSADGQTALVGASAARSSAGAAWVFTRQEGTSWGNAQELTGGSESSEGHFGLSVALSENGDTALIGGPTVSGVTWNAGVAAPTFNAGAAWVFTRPSAGQPFIQSGVRLTVHGEHEDEHEIGEGRFGYSVALSGDGNTALVGARGDSEGAGAAWIFTRLGGVVWTQGPKLTALGEGTQVEFGYSVALSTDGGTALVGSPKAGGGDGAAWLFSGSGSSWSDQQELTVGEERGQGLFGASVALSANGERALVGAPADGGGVGAAWPFRPPPGPSPQVTSVSPETGPAAGGTEVTIGGANFDEVEEVKFASRAAKVVGVNVAGTAITVIDPPGSNTVPVTVRTASGTDTLSSAFTYQSSGKPSPPSPVIESVSPAEGPATGGTAVTIQGSHFEEVETVDFGSVAATNVTVSSADSITAVAPAEAPGAVDVRVTTAAGTSALKRPKDQFTFSAATPGGVSGSGSSSTPTSANDAVLGFGPDVRASCAVALVSRGVAVAAHNRATVRLSSTGLAFSGLCTGRLTIEVKVRLKTKRGHKQRFGARAIGAAGFSITSGRGATVTVKLNRAGRALLASHHGRLSAKLVLVVIPGPARAHSAIVHLALAKSRPAKPKPVK